MSEYIRGFDSGINCILAEIERIEKNGPITVDQVIRLLDPKRDQKTPQKPEKTPSQGINEWFGLDIKEMPDKWMGNRAFLAGAKWAAKQLKEKNNVGS